MFSLWEWTKTGPACQGRLWSPHFWRYSKLPWRRPWAACYSWPCSEQRVGAPGPFSLRLYMIQWQRTKKTAILVIFPALFVYFNTVPLSHTSPKNCNSSNHESHLLKFRLSFGLFSVNSYNYWNGSIKQYSIFTEALLEWSKRITAWALCVMLLSIHLSITGFFSFFLLVGSSVCDLGLPPNSWLTSCSSACIYSQKHFLLPAISCIWDHFFSLAQ